MKFYGFSAEYLERLVHGDSFVEEHFTAYFGELMFLKLRHRLGSHPQLLEDIRQETLLRVLKALREGKSLDQPESLGAFVNGVCNHVMQELSRKEFKHNQITANQGDPVDNRVDLDLPLVNEERKRLVERILSELTERDRTILKMLYLEEKSAHEVSTELGVDQEYLRVLLHRAKSRFKSKMQRVVTSA